MAKDEYRGFKDKVHSDVGQASLAAQGMEGNRPAVLNSTKVRIKHSDVERVVPSGCSIEVQPFGFHKLKFGDIILCRIDKDMQLRRFIKIQMQKNQTFLCVTRQGRLAMQELIKETTLVGRVMGYEHRGEHVDPYKLEKGMEAFKNWVTEFGTSTPVERIAAFFSFFKANVKKG